MARGAQAKAAKADAQSKKEAEAAAQKEKQEADQWSKGAKGKSKADDKAEKAAQAAAKKAEAARLLAEEEASIAAKAPKQAAPAKKAGNAKKPAAAAPAKSIPTSLDEATAEPTSFSASGIDDALDAMTLVTEKTDKASVGSKAAQSVDLHPERRFKAAFEAYKEKNLPQIKKDYPGLRLQQYHDRLYKDFQKSPENPFNQTTMAYNTTKSEKVAALQSMRNETAERLRDD